MGNKNSLLNMGKDATKVMDNCYKKDFSDIGLGAFICQFLKQKDAEIREFYPSMSDQEREKVIEGCRKAYEEVENYSMDIDPMLWQYIAAEYNDQFPLVFRMAEMQDQKAWAALSALDDQVQIVEGEERFITIPRNVPGETASERLANFIKEKGTEDLYQVMAFLQGENDRFMAMRQEEQKEHLPEYVEFRRTFQDLVPRSTDLTEITRSFFFIYPAILWGDPTELGYKAERRKGYDKVFKRSEDEMGNLF